MARRRLGDDRCGLCQAWAYCSTSSLGDTMRYKLNRLFTSRRLEKRYGFSQKLMLLSRTDRLNTSRDYDDMITFTSATTAACSASATTRRFLPAEREKFAALFEDIRNARYSVNVLYYGFHQDAVGRSLVNLLTERPGAGVKGQSDV